MDGIRIELLNESHIRGEFSCGKPPLDAFIQTMASQHARKNISRTFVARRIDEAHVIGYYTLVASAIAFAEFPPALSKKLPKHPIPSILVARLAVDQSCKGKGLGRILLFDSLRHAVEISAQIGVYAVHVHAMDTDAGAFYSKYGFECLPGQTHHLFLTLETIGRGSG